MAEHDGITQQRHYYCARCAAAMSEHFLMQVLNAAAAESPEPLGEQEVEARQSSSWASIEQFLSDYLRPGGGAKAATDREKRRIAPRVARMASRLPGAMPDTVREFLAKYGSLVV